MELSLVLDNRRNGGEILESLTRPLRLFPDNVGGMIVSRPTLERIKSAIALRGAVQAQVGQSKSGTIGIKVDGATVYLKPGERQGTAAIRVKIDPQVIAPEWYATWVKINVVKRLQASQAFEALRQVEQALTALQEQE